MGLLSNALSRPSLILADLQHHLLMAVSSLPGRFVAAYVNPCAPFNECEGSKHRRRRKKQKERLLELEVEVEKLAQLSKGACSERAALLERNLKLKV